MTCLYGWKKEKIIDSSKRARHTQYMFAEVGQDEVGGNGRNLVQARLAELALHVIFRGEAIPAVRLKARIGRLPGCVSRQQLSQVRLGAAGLLCIEETRRFVAH